MVSTLALVSQTNLPMDPSEISSDGVICVQDVVSVIPYPSVVNKNQYSLIGMIIPLPR